MTWIVFATIYMSSANVEELFKAKTSAQIQQHHQRESEISTLQQRCEAEIRGQFVPENCFKWLHRQPLSPVAKKFYLNWFAEACDQALQRDRSQAQYHLRSISVFTASCRQRILSSANDWLYKTKKEGMADALASTNIGKEIEIVLRHEDMAGQIVNRAPVIRTPR